MSSPTRLEAAPSVADCCAPPAPRIAPTMAPTMPLRIRPAPRAASQPQITLVQLVPSRSASVLRCSARGSSALCLSVMLSAPYHKYVSTDCACEKRYSLPVLPCGEVTGFDSGEPLCLR